METLEPVHALALAAAKTQWRDLAADVQRQALDLIGDTLAVIAVGTLHPHHKQLASVFSSDGPCTRLDGQQPADPLVAAYVNGAATTVWQLQDGHRMAKGHPASHLVPALLAVAEETGASGAAFLSAFVAGYEVGARIGLAMGGLNPLIHDAGTWSTIGAAAGAAHLLSKGDPHVIARAINGCASITPMFDNETVTQGAAIHHSNIGIGAQTAIIAAKAAQAELSILNDALPRYFSARASADFNMDAVANGIDPIGGWRHFEVQNAYFKVHPTCAHLHGVNDAVQSLLETHTFAPADIAQVDVSLYQAAMRYDVHAPTCDLSMRFSARASAACGLHFGGLTFETFSFDALSNSAVRALMERIHIRHDPALDSDYPAGRPSHVRISLRGGETLEKGVTYPLGDCTNPMTPAQKREKALGLLTRRYGERSSDILAALDESRDATSLAQLCEMLRGS